MPNNQTKPDTNQTQTTPAGARGGIGRSRVEVPGQSRSISRVTTRPPMRERYAAELAWAGKHLPGPFVALGVARIRRQGGKPTVDSVMAYLRELGRDAASREAS